MIIYRGEPQITQMVRIYTDFYFQMNGICHVEPIETSHVAQR